MDESLLMTLPPEQQIEEISRLNDQLGWRMFNEFLDVQIKRTQDTIFGTAQMSGEQLIHARATFQTLQTMKRWAVTQVNMARHRISVSEHLR